MKKSMLFLTLLFSVVAFSQKEIEEVNTKIIKENGKYHCSFK
jgi:hypothetical protein